MQFDIILIDVTTPRPYELNTLTTHGLGGTEASCIRIMEGLGQLGLKTAIFEHNLDIPLEGKNCWYLPLSYLDHLTSEPAVVIALRGAQYLDRFKTAKKISFHQDVPNQVMESLRQTLIDQKVTVVGASQWHKGMIEQKLHVEGDASNPRVEYIYNPVPDVLYIPKSTEIKYNKNKIVWPASPHKGLKPAIELLKAYIEATGNKDLRLHIFNPGYFHSDDELPSFVINHGSVPCSELWQHVSESLCVFYPTSFEETFGCIAAEANAIHTPVLTHRIAALNETISSQRQFVEADHKAVINTLKSWQEGQRPVVWGNEQFRHSKVIQDWVKLFTSIPCYGE